MNRNTRPIAITLLALVAVSSHAQAKHRAPKPAPVDAAAQGDPAAGSEVFKTHCFACHGKEGGGTALAPPLLGVVGSKAATSPFSAYSPALKASGAVWSPAKLDSFLAGPGKLIPGTRMAVSLPKVDDRQNLIAYLATLKK